MKKISMGALLVVLPLLFSCNNESKKSEQDLEIAGTWAIDFIDDFESFEPDHWQDQMIWVNNEKQSYVPNNEFGTREVSE